MKNLTQIFFNYENEKILIFPIKVLSEYKFSIDDLNLDEFYR